MLKIITMSFVLLLLQRRVVRCSEVEDYIDSKPEKSSPVEVRAVFINCEPYERGSESDTTRFERQELFKHNALQDCNKKLALTVKMASESDQSPGDEYIPIDHVFEGLDKKRVRLLNPYVLRLRREPPLQAYQLRRIDTVSGVLTSSDKGKSQGNHNIFKRGRAHREANQWSAGEWTDDVVGGPAAAAVFTLDHDEPGRQSYSVRIANVHDLMVDNSTEDGLVSKDCGLRLYSRLPASSPRTVSSQSERHRATTGTTEQNKKLEVGSGRDRVTTSTMYQQRRKHGKYRQKEHCTVRTAYLNKTSQRLEKRCQQNVKIEGVDLNNSDQYYQHQDTGVQDTLRVTPRGISPDNYGYKDASEGKELVKASEMKRQYSGIKDRNHQSGPPDANEALDVTEKADDLISYTIDNLQGQTSQKKTNKIKSEDVAGSDEKDFALFEIGSPSLWFKVHVQLFEKLSTPEGKTVWNDMTKGVQASVSTTNPEWSCEDMNLRYRPVEWVARDKFTLPKTSLCLLMPVENEDVNTYDKEFGDSEADSDNFGNEEYIVVPLEDVVGVEDGNNLIKRDDSHLPTSNSTEKGAHRRVEVRVSRALLGGAGGGVADRFGVASRGSDRFLTLPHRRPHRAQLDLEARADGNQLVRVGSSGCIATIVADNTRRTRTILTVQATNTGLVSAHFRVKAQDCGPALPGPMSERNNEGATTGPVLLPPRHTRRLRLELPVEMPVDLAHCSVALVNEAEESVAIRDVAIKRGDRCFCVWHCDCVCLSEDPKLLCREMSAARQAAAGLRARTRPRHARAAQYKDCVTVNLTIIICGVLLFLLILGTAKAIIGLKCRCVGLFGLGLILQMPRTIDHYFEKCIRCRAVVYNCDGWPVHPDTKKRTVLPVSRHMLFLLNVIYFVVLPFVLVRDATHQLCAQCNSCAQRVKKACNKCDTSKKCFSSHDIQNVDLQLRRRRRPALRRWMTPHAEQLSGDIWQRDLVPTNITTEEAMRPLLHETSRRPRSPRTRAERPRPRSARDSEQDDTEYVLTQMQKSRESLAHRSQKKQNDSVPSLQTKHRRNEPMPSK